MTGDAADREVGPNECVVHRMYSSEGLDAHRVDDPTAVKPQLIDIVRLRVYS